VHLRDGGTRDRQPDRIPADFCGIVALADCGLLIHKLLKMATGWLNRLLAGLRLPARVLIAAVMFWAS